MPRQVLRLCGLLLTSFAGVGCALTPDAPDKEALDRVVAAWERNFNDHDAKALAGLYTEDADGVFGYEDIVRGRDAMEKHWAEHFTKNPDVTTKQAVVRRKVITPTIVVEDGEWEEYGHTDPEALARPNKGLWFAALVKKNDEWFIACDRGCSPIPEAGQDE